MISTERKRESCPKEASVFLCPAWMGMSLVLSSLDISPLHPSPFFPFPLHLSFISALQHSCQGGWTDFQNSSLSRAVAEASLGRKPQQILNYFLRNTRELYKFPCQIFEAKHWYRNSVFSDVFSVLQTTLHRLQSREEEKSRFTCHKSAGWAGERVPGAGWSQ